MTPSGKPSPSALTKSCRLAEPLAAPASPVALASPVAQADRAVQADLLRKAAQAGLTALVRLPATLRARPARPPAILQDREECGTVLVALVAWEHLVAKPT